MSQKFVVEKTYEIVITEDDLEPGEVLDADLALEIARDTDISEWDQVDIDVVGVR